MKALALVVLVRFVLGVPMFALGLVLALGAGVNAVWAFVLAVVLGWVAMTLVVIAIGDGLPFWGVAAPWVASAVVSLCIALYYARVTDDSPVFDGLAIGMAGIAAACLLLALVSHRRARRSAIDFDADVFGRASS